MRRNQVRFWIVLTLLFSAAAFLHTRSRAETLPPRLVLDSFPSRLGDWTSRQIYIADDIRKILGDGDFLQRVYTRSPSEPAMELFLAYFPSQRTGSTIHSPRNCLPGAGWVPVDASQVPLRQPDGKIAFVNRYIIQKGMSRQLVLYWYQSHGRLVASEYWAKFYLVADAISMNRTDGALVRIITALPSGENVDHAQQRAMEFTQLVLPNLHSFVPQ
jgi:EpsI family protein